ncbi:MAG: 5-formyltetrahydrofolate cyclo-ligase [Deltaproteobacteria bacterium CG2_30_66_27]|nr:MAG: 5-formyltetrahydrofolate cyclo-ligase [Deltaproteobacteria bacterium CG2_30_66_27]PJB31394.1 MAG: 5-formyltetrahydrofolate cyclo-ligase [Deltaproteobacteria bacterium CG_4_9_14_3_um_filter_65_9]
MLVLERKEILRREGRIRCRERSISTVSAEAGERAQEHFLREFPPRAGVSAALYCALAGEIPTDRIRHAYLGAGARLYYPRTTESRTLAFYPHREGDGWETGPYGISEPPKPTGVEPRLAGWDIVVIPGLAFDRRGNRLGHGFGYYDRFLGGLPKSVPRVGLAFAGQLVPEVPVDAWDVPVHALVTEEGVIRAANASGPLNHR